MIYLAQTDTTAGFLSQNLEQLNRIKGREISRPCVICVASFKQLARFTRAPQKHKNLIRRARKTTFIYPNNRAIRVVKDHPHAQFLAGLGWAYSTSANRHKCGFNLDFATKMADIIIGDPASLFEAPPSSLIKLSVSRIKKIR